ncbi:MAG: hypothetical protein U9R50_00655 [Campylobacterota bacterium]|nr:hypothetical protein [Campylobacterota bacterium]
MKKSSKKFRQMQRNRILRTKPWLHSTGPQTIQGKERAKMNALKTDPEIHKLLREATWLWKRQKEIYNALDGCTNSSISLKKIILG